MIKLDLIPNWREKNLTCHFCGSKKSVKYAWRSNGVAFPCCNKCALTYILED